MKRTSAQDAYAWTTTVEIEKSKYEIEKLLRKRGCVNVVAMLRDEPKIELNVLCELDGRSLGFTYSPLPLDQGRLTKRSDRRELAQQQIRQMGRIALRHIGVTFDLMDLGMDEQLIPYLMLPGANGKLTTLQQQGIEQITQALTLSSKPALTDGGRKYDER